MSGAKRFTVVDLVFFLIVATMAMAMVAMFSGKSHGATLPPDFVETELAAGLPELTGFAFLPDGRTLLFQKTGRIYVRSVGGAIDTAFTVSGLYTFGEAGLGGVAVDPEWPTRPYVYIHYCRATPRENVVARLTATGDLSDPSSVALAFGSEFTILTIPQVGSNHNGQCLRFGPSGALYVSLGDNVSSCVAQNPATLKGVVTRLRVDTLADTGSGPPAISEIAYPGNPWASDTTAAALVLAHGLRNPFRFSVDPYTEVLYVGDVGGLVWEEIDEVFGGENFGWPIWEADSLTGVNCGNGVIPYTHPIVSYFHDPADPQGGAGNFAVIGGPVYRGGTAPGRFPLSYEGVLFYADFIKGWIRCSKSVSGTWQPFLVSGQADSVNWAKGLGLVTDLQQGPDGSIYYTNRNGRFRRISYVGPVSGTASPPKTPALIAYPNPMLATFGARISGMDAPAFVFDPQGRFIARLESPEWRGVDATGRRVAPGSYWIVDSRDRVARVVVLP